MRFAEYAQFFVFVPSHLSPLQGNEPAKEAVRRLEVNLRPMAELELKADELRDAEQQFQVPIIILFVLRAAAMLQFVFVCQIGRRYHNGLNCPQNITRAIEWYTLLLFFITEQFETHKSV